MSSYIILRKHLATENKVKLIEMRFYLKRFFAKANTKTFKIFAFIQIFLKKIMIKLFQNFLLLFVCF